MKKVIYMPVLLACALCFVNSANAEMYKWTDKNGETHYTETPPPADAKGKDIEPEIKLSTGNLGNKTDFGTTGDKKTKNSTETDATKQADQEAAKKSETQHRDFCAQQKSALQQMTTNSLVKLKDAQGERLLTAVEKEQKIKETQQNLASMCGPQMFRDPNAGNDTDKQEQTTPPTPSNNTDTSNRSEDTSKQ